jgi:tRNA (guanine6-N2)-methyltransferase
VNGIEGLVLVDVEESPQVHEALCSIRSAHYVMRLTLITDLPQTTNAVCDLVQFLMQDPAARLPDISKAEYFRVRSSRFGLHAFRSVDIERDVGEAIHEYYGVPARMRGASTIVRADVIGDKVVLGVQIHGEELSKRLHPEFIRDASIRPNVAFAMLHFAGYKAGDVLLDPFVGSGTIALEAAVRYPTNRIVGIDKSERVVKGAQANADILGLKNVELTAANARNLRHVVARASVDCIVTNPPWGIRIGKNDEMDDLYRGFLASATEVLKIGGRIACLLVRWEAFLHHCRSSGRWRVTMARPIRTGDITPVLFVVERVEDTMWNDIKREIFALVDEAKKGDGVTTLEAFKGRPDVVASAADGGAVDGVNADTQETDAPKPRRRFSQ